jgi:hypothetical protein
MATISNEYKEVGDPQGRDGTWFVFDRIDADSSGAATKSKAAVIVSRHLLSTSRFNRGIIAEAARHLIVEAIAANYPLDNLSLDITMCEAYRGLRERAELLRMLRRIHAATEAQAAARS